MKRWLSLLLVCTFVFTLGFSATAAEQVSTAQKHSFLVVFSTENSLPSNYKSIVEAAGGEITYEVPKIGTIEAQTTNPTVFIKALLKNSSIKGLAPSIELPLNLPETNVNSVDLSNSSLEPVPLGESIFDAGWQWDIEKVTNKGSSHAISSGSKDVVVGVIDTGFDFNHPDLVNNIVPGSKTFVPGTTDAWDYNSHGTHVAGTIGANGRVKGIAPEVGLRAYRVFGASGGAQQIWITDAIIAAANDGVEVINMSLGGTRVIGQWYYTDPATGETFRLGNDAADMVAYNRAIRYAINKNVTVVASAGNDGQDLSNPAKLADWYNAVLDANPATKDYDVRGAAFKVPSQTPGAVTVSATGGGFGTEDRLAFYSNYGNGAIDIAAPGGDVGPDPANRPADYYKYLVLSTIPTYMPSVTAEALFGERGYGWKGGTSMAAPQVSGVAAAYIAKVYKETGKKPTPSQVTAHLQQTAVDSGKKGYDPLYGSGIVNAYNALTR